MSQLLPELQEFYDKIANGEIEIPYNRNFWLSTGNTRVKKAIIESLSRKIKEK